MPRDRRACDDMDDMTVNDVVTADCGALAKPSLKAAPTVKLAIRTWPTSMTVRAW